MASQRRPASSEIAANQAEGAYRENGKGIATVDVIPYGKERLQVKLGDQQPRQLMPMFSTPAMRR